MYLPTHMLTSATTQYGTLCVLAVSLNVASSITKAVYIYIYIYKLTLSAPCRHTEGEGVLLHSFLNSALSGQPSNSLSCRFVPGGRTRYHSIGDCLGCRFIPDTLWNTHIYCSCLDANAEGPQPQDIHII